MSVIEINKQTNKQTDKQANRQTNTKTSTQRDGRIKSCFTILPPRIKAALPKAAMVEAWVSLKLRALVLSLVRDSTAEPP